MISMLLKESPWSCKVACYPLTHIDPKLVTSDTMMERLSKRVTHHLLEMKQISDSINCIDWPAGVVAGGG